MSTEAVVMDSEVVINALIGVTGGLGIFLLGMKFLSEGLQAVAGSGLRRMISLVTDNRLMAVTVGLTITVLVQSSSITTVMVVGLVNSGFMVLKQALGVIFGANIGTTITGWIVLLKVGKYGLPMIGIAAFFYLFSKNERMRYTGMIVMGVGMVFFGMELMKKGLKPVSGTTEFKAWFHMFEASSYFGILKCALVGTIFTAIVQSSSATLVIIMSIAITGLIDFQTAAALVIGGNIGTTITAILASIGTNTNAKRAAYGHMIFNVVGVVLVIIIFPFFMHLVEWIVGSNPNEMVLVDGDETFPKVAFAISITHTLFNVINMIVFLPFINQVAWLTIKMAPDKGRKETPHLAHLDIRMLDTPALGIEQSRKELEFMGESTELMMDWLYESMTDEKKDPEKIQKIFHREEVMDNVQHEITDFLGSLISGQITHDVMENARSQLRIADEFESVSDYIVNVQKLLIRLEKAELVLSKEGREEILDLHSRIKNYLKMITNAVRTENHDILSKANSQGEEITYKIKEYRQNHLVRLAEEKVVPQKSLIFNDILHAYRKIKDHALNIAEVLGGEK